MRFITLFALIFALVCPVIPAAPLDEAAGAPYQLARSRILGEYEQERAAELLRGYIEALSEPVRDLPSRSSAYWRLGNAYEQLKRVPDARASYEKAVQLDGKNDEARKSLKKLGRD